MELEVWCRTKEIAGAERFPYQKINIGGECWSEGEGEDGIRFPWNKKSGLAFVSILVLANYVQYYRSNVWKAPLMQQP